MQDEPREPQLESLLDLAIENALSITRTMLPGKVVSFDSARQKASVQILIKEAHLDEFDNRVSEVVAELSDVPVWFNGGSTGRITVPVLAGDYGMIVFASRSIARWKLKGGIIDPGDDRRHDVSDCVFVPGLHDFAHVPTTAPTDAIVTHGQTRLGGPDATSTGARVALRSDLELIKPAILAGIDGQIASLTPGLPGTATEIADLTALRADISANWPVCATKVRAE